MGQKIKNIIGLGGIAILSLSLTSGGERSHISVNENEFALTNDSHFVIENDTFHFLSIEKDSAAYELLYSNNVAFWKKDIMLSSDSFLVVNQFDRQVFDVVHKNSVNKIERSQNLTTLGTLYGYRYNVPQQIKIKFVRGRREFFDYAVIGPKLKEAYKVFNAVGADPTIAQLLLLIESPNNHKGVSHSGAAGHFQIMPSVARKYGLRINARFDERHNFARSSYAAARLVKEYCIPQAKRICNARGIEISEESLWFKLLALHIYNAGAGNVSIAVRHLPEVANGNELIKRLWRTNVGAFQNSSQNYSQVCLASYLGYKDYLKSKTQK
jgi:hypothetical protein